MIKITFGADEQRINEEITTNWIVQSLNNRRDANLPSCLNVIVKHNQIDVSFSYGDCPASGGGKSIDQFSSESQYIIKLWRDAGLFDSDPPIGKLIKFLKKLFKELNLNLR